MTDISEISLQVLGSSGGFPIAGLPCSGYRYRAGDKNLLLDCGPGIATALLGEDGKSHLDAVVISHLHPDHVLDLIPLGYSLLTEWIHDGRTSPMPLFVPPGGRDFLGRFSSLFGHGNWRFQPASGTPGYQAIADVLARGEDWMLTVFDIREYVPGETIVAAGLTIDTLATDHGVPTAAMKLGPLGRQIVYSADTRFTTDLVAFSRDTALLLADAHLSGPKAPGGAHMSPAEAGRVAEQAGVGRLVLCHLGAPEDGPSARAAAGAQFFGPIHLAMSERDYQL